MFPILSWLAEASLPSPFIPKWMVSASLSVGANTGDSPVPTWSMPYFKGDCLQLSPAFLLDSSFRIPWPLYSPHSMQTLKCEIEWNFFFFFRFFDVDHFRSLLNFVIILLLGSVLVFWPRGMQDFSFPIITTGPPGKSQNEIAVGSYFILRLYSTHMCFVAWNFLLLNCVFQAFVFAVVCLEVYIFNLHFSLFQSHPKIWFIIPTSWDVSELDIHWICSHLPTPCCSHMWSVSLSGF